MANLTVTLPDNIEDRLKLRANAHGFASAEDYVLDLVTRDLDFPDAMSRLRALDAAIAEGLADAAAGRVQDLDAVFDAVEAKLTRMGAR